MNPPPITLLLRPPTVTLTEWMVFEVVLNSFDGPPTWHLVGIEVDGHATHPRVSSPILAIDEVMQTCATLDGDIYHLKGECSILPGDELIEWAMWKENLSIQSDKNVTWVITNAFARLDQQLLAWQPERPEDFPNDWFVGIPVHKDSTQYSIAPNSFQLDERHQLSLRLAVQCAQFYQYERGNQANLRPFYFASVVEEALQGWDITVKERRWIFRQAQEVELG